VNRVNARAAAVPLSGRRESYAERADGPARPRIRWAWIAGCVVLGLAAIAAGWAIVLDANRTGYVAGVLANVGTTLLLVGFVVLLERRIVDSAVRAVRNANDEARRAAGDDFDAQMRDLEERLRTSWGSGSLDAEAEVRRMADEYSRRIGRRGRRRRARLTAHWSERASVPRRADSPRPSTQDAVSVSVTTETVVKDPRAAGFIVFA